MQKSIFTKYFSVCATLILVSVIILGTIFLLFASQYFKEDKCRLLRSNVERAAALIEEYKERNLPMGAEWERVYFTNSFRALSEAINATFFITDLQGTAVYCTETPPCVHLDSSISESVLDGLSKNGRYEEMGNLGSLYEERYYTVAVPLYLEGKATAYVFASAHTGSQLQGFLTDMMKMFLISAAAVLLIAFAAIYFVTLQMVNPLRQMVEAAQKFGRGEFDMRLSIDGDSGDEMGQLAMALNNMAQSLSTLEVTRRSFVANVSHELKTPMTSISGFIDGILDGTIPPDKHGYYLRIVSEEMARLSRLVKTMLNLSRLEAGEMKVSAENVNIVEIVCQTVFTFERQIEQKQLEIRGLDHEKVMIEADPDLMHQVVYNLTENAVKFVNQGGYIAFDFSCDGARHFISVKNSGAGLAKDELPKVFDRFYKTDKSRAKDKNGVGLGLYIVRSIVSLHGGDIVVRSREGEYTEFVISIPRTDLNGSAGKKFKKS